MSAEELGEAASSIIRSVVGSTDYPQVIADDEINLCVFANELAIVVAPIRGERTQAAIRCVWALAVCVQCETNPVAACESRATGRRGRLFGCTDSVVGMRVSASNT